MNYLIMSTKEIHSEQFVDLMASGNEYNVYYGYGEDASVGVNKIYKTIEEAMAVYNKFVMAFATGCWSVEDRKKFFN